MSYSTPLSGIVKINLAPRAKTGESAGSAGHSGRNRIIQGVGNGVFGVVNNVTISRHLHFDKVAVVERRIDESEIAVELVKLERLEQHFAPAGNEETFALIVRDNLGKAKALIQNEKINIEGAINRVITEALDGKGEKEGVRGKILKLREEKEKIGRQIVEISRSLNNIHEADARREKLVLLGELDKTSENLRVSLGRFEPLAADLENLFERIMTRLTALEEEDQREGELHVAGNLAWPEIQAIYSAGAMGFILDSGVFGPISHPFIFAHGNGIPLVTIENPLDRVGVSCRVSIDSRTGQVVIDPSPTTVSELERRKKGYAELVRLFKNNEGSHRTLDDQPIPELQLNIKDRDTPSKIKGRGIGLFRSEGLYAQKRPDVPVLVRAFKNLFSMTDLVNIRLFDIDSDKIPQFFNENEVEAFNGTRGGIDFLLKTEIGRSILTDQIKALLIACDRCAHNKIDLEKKTLRLILPMVTGAQEVREVKKIIEAIEKDLIARRVIEKEVRGHIQIGAMIETSAAVLNAEEIAAEAPYFSIGGNDLTKDVLGFGERKKMMTGKEYDWLSPPVLKAIKRTIEVAKAKGIQVGFCGEMARDPMGAILLSLMGIDSLSMDESYVREINFVLTKMNLGEWNNFSELDPDKLSVVEKALKLEDAQQVREFIYDLIFNHAHADTRLSLAHLITSARPFTYQEEAVDPT